MLDVPRGLGGDLPDAALLRAAGAQDHERGVAGHVERVFEGAGDRGDHWGVIRGVYRQGDDPESEEGAD